MAQTWIWVNTSSGDGCCLLALSLNQCWLIISKVKWYLRKISQKIPEPSIMKISLKISYIDFSFKSPGAKDFIEQITSFKMAVKILDNLTVHKYLQAAQWCGQYMGATVNTELKQSKSSIFLLWEGSCEFLFSVFPNLVSRSSIAILCQSDVEYTHSWPGKP